MCRALSAARKWIPEMNKAGAKGRIISPVVVIELESMDPVAIGVCFVLHVPIRRAKVVVGDTSCASFPVEATWYSNVEALSLNL